MFICISYEYPVNQKSFLKFVLLIKCFCIFVRNCWDVFVYVCFWVLCFVQLICMSVCWYHIILIMCVCICTLSCLALCNPVDCSPPGSSVHGVSQARILEWVARLFSRGSFQHRDQTHVSGIGRRILYTGGFTLAMFSGPWVSQVCSFFKNSQNQLRKIINSIIPSWESTFAPNLFPSNMKRKIDNYINTIMVRDINTLLLIMDRTTRENIN